MFTPHQSAYFAYWLTQTGKIEEQVSRAVASARVDMNPHQVEAACFALKSPLEKGVLLADEVGLGKTIEASLVMAQKWAEQKRNILLVVPASLRKQWAQELQEKFELPSIVIDSKIAAALKKEGAHNPFEHDDKIVICSYDYVARQCANVQLVLWDLVVFDEAHKLRNVHKKKGSKRAKEILNATASAASRVLLSATPIQNDLMELYGLSQVIDEHFFGDEKSFRSRYLRKKNTLALEELKERIKPLCHRTLRRQVQEEGGIKFTNRYAFTEDFTPSGPEWELYERLSEYLQDPDNIAIHPKAKHLVSMGLRKILASSSFAVADTLRGMVRRLKEAELLDDDDIADLDAKDDWQDVDFGESADDASSQERAPKSKIQQEIAVLADCLALAENIKSNAKGEALLRVLKNAMANTENLGGQAKAVIFTESCRTQQYLFDELEKNGYQGRLVLLNGSNTDSGSQAIYQAWKVKHAGSSRISGSKTADMKAALVEKFKSDEADILISTEAGGEGINLQFCSLLINYDLPWNPQKIEQRIGRVHRYGQTNDVVIFNFVNRKNPADQRVYQLLSEKLHLFEGVFGASDEVLGAVASSIDIEKRIYEIFQKCRSDEQVQYEFDRLQEEMSESLTAREANARESLLANFDREVVANLKNSRDKNKIFLQEYEHMLLDLAKAELPGAKFEDTHFVYEGKRFDVRWHLAEENDSEFFRLQAAEHYKAWDLVKMAKARELPEVSLQLSYDQLQQGNYGALRPYIGQAGDLAVVNMTFSYNQGKTRPSQIFVLARTDKGEWLPAAVADHLLCIPGQHAPLQHSINHGALSSQLGKLVEEQTGVKEEELGEYLERETQKLEFWAKDRRDALEQTVKELDEDIRQFKKTARELASTKEKIEAKKSLRKLERQRDDAFEVFHHAKKGIEQEEDRLLDEVSSKLELSCEAKMIFQVRWQLNH
ncbi:SNF2-related protein [Marinagarivorans algicola]|uniref:SNF2-related protein n=1 Tax=Marinagarivorans algicola TaxID=1513270 RepID=UPI0006B594EF|nr:SNF2-related protein [Marinagarivorans algicola]